MIRWAAGDGSSAAHLRFHHEELAGQHRFALTRFEDPNVAALSDSDLPLVAWSDLGERFGVAMSGGSVQGTFRRVVASNRGLELFGPGDPFIDALWEFTELDDRGRAFTLWRARDYWRGQPEFFAVCLDVRIRPDIETALSVAGALQPISADAVRRRAESYLAPTISRVWLDGTLSEIVDQKRLQILDAPYHELREDKTIRPAQWSRIDEHVGRAEWPAWCAMATKRAIAIAFGRDDLRERCAAAGRRSGTRQRRDARAPRRSGGCGKPRRRGRRARTRPGAERGPGASSGRDRRSGCRDRVLRGTARGRILVIDLVLVQEALAAWPDAPPSALANQTPRLAAVLQAAAARDCGPGDLAGMVRDTLRCWQEQAGQEPLPSALSIPATSPWPTVEEWRMAGVSTAPGHTPEQLRITAVAPWRPAWLTSEEPADAFPASRLMRRVKDATAGDPVWEHATGLESYRSLEQREAVRTVISAPPDATVLILLPTGSGKSLVGLLHPLAVGPGATTVVVVPTTSLAIDQEEQLRERLRAVNAPDAEEPFAFYGAAQTARTRTQRLQILQRVRDGGQRAVFTSPEALFGALGEALTVAAQAGQLGQLVIDEAHIVASWGTEFRPDFQALAGFRRRLRAAAAENGHVFRTLLLTATATRSDVETLAALFSEEGRKLVAGGAAALRPELAYLVAQATDRDERRDFLVEAVRHLPRPMFVYATTREDVAELESLIRQLGIQRVVRVTGETGDEARRAAAAGVAGQRRGANQRRHRGRHLSLWTGHRRQRCPHRDPRLSARDDRPLLPRGGPRRP